MDILIGIIYLTILPSGILLLASLAISPYEKKHIIQKTKGTDYYSKLFNVYSK